MATDNPLRPDDVGNSTATAMLSAARRQDPQAWEQLVDRYSALVYHWCRQAGLAVDDSADVLQCVMMKVAQHLPRFEKDGKPAAFRRWLATVTRTCIIDFVRTDRAEAHGPGGTDALHRLRNVSAPCATDTGSGVQVQPQVRQLEPLLQQVEEAVEASTWEAFRLTVLEDFASAEAGVQLGMSPAAVRLAKGRVLRRLRNGLSSGPGAPN